ncbi:MAG: carboxypeptidase regulatory-like domain-containing protein [Vicinamibacterales bacterium]
MRHDIVRWAMALATILALASPSTYAQGGAASTLSGVVMDASGGVIPGANVVVKSDTTGTEYTAVTDTNGTFTIPAIPPGLYTATISLQGFKTAVLKDIIINVGVPASVKASLEVGGLEETIVVAGASEVLQTQRTAVATTLTEKQIMNIPIPGRGAFELVGLLPGVASSTGSIRDSTVNGLPQSSVNITLDGMNIQDNYAKSWDGMFTRVSPRLDAVEEITVATASQGADTAGQGSVQIKFVTRSGTNQYMGSGYYYMRRDWMNTNSWFNLNRNVDATGKPAAKSVLKQYQPGGRFGGPIVRDKAFFFINYELVHTPGTRGDTRTIMSPSSERGVFQYGGRPAVDLMQLAASNGQVSTIDPVIAKLLGDVRAASATTGTVSDTNDPLVQSYFWQQATKGETKYPTVKLDYNITSNHRATFSTTRNNLLSNPDTTNSRQQVFPGFPFRGLQDSKRYTMTGSVRSVLSSNLVNEFRLGATGGPTKFSPDINPGMFDAPVGNMGGYGISWSGFRGISNTYTTTNYSAREGSTKVVENTLNWLRGRHGLSIGASVTRADVWLQNKQHVPSLTLGMATGDPADSMFNTTNFPGATGTDLTNARNLYSVLTGRITSIGREARIGADGKLYQILGESMQEGRLWDVGVFLQDSWRWRPNLTVNAGLRYGVQLPFTALNNSYSTATVADLFGITGPGAGFVPGSLVTGTGNLHKPGVFEGSPTTYKLLEADTRAYKTDWNNLAPSIGAAWTFGFADGWGRKIFGSEDSSVLRAGYNLAYQRGGMSDFVEVFGNNPGILIDATRNQNNGNLGTLPVLLRSSDLSAPAIPLERVYPMAVPSVSSNVRVFDPDIKVPWASSYSIGLERALARDLSVEVRVVHTDSKGGWTLNNLDGQRNYNELTTVENGFIDEFRVAQANLFANVQAGRGNTFAYTGVAGTSPLPIFFAHLNTSGSAGTPASYTGSGWTNTTLVQSMFRLNPNPLTAANQLRSTASFRTNMVRAGLPANFWVVNPDVTTAGMITNGGDTSYNGVQLIVNRRFARGFMAQANYSFASGHQQDFYSFRKPYLRVKQSQTRADTTAGSGIITHALAMNWVYELPFGTGKRFASNVNPWVDRIIGSWSFQGVGRFQSGRLIDFGNVRMVGFDAKELQKMFKIRMTKDQNNQYRTLVWILPEDVIDNTIKAFSLNATGYASGEPAGRYFAPANGPECLEVAATSNTSSTAGYGDCGTGSLTVSGPKVIRWDMNLVKQIPLAGRLRLEYQLQVFNVFNRVNFNPTNFIGTVVDSYQVTGAVDQARTAQMAFRFSW